MTEPTFWPDDARCAVVFSFDLDADVGWRLKARSSPEWDRPMTRTRGEFGPRVGVPRIIELFDKHDAQCSFFVPGKVVETWTDVVHTVREAGHEIAHHGYDHAYPSTLSPDEEKEKLQQGLDAFDRHLGFVPRGYRSPGGDPSDHTIEFLADAGFAYDSSLMNADRPYLHDESGIVEVPFDWSFDDWAYFAFNAHPPLTGLGGIEPAAPVFDDWKRAIDGQRKHGNLVVFTMHPQLTGRTGRIDALGELLEWATSMDDVWVTTAGEVASHWIERHG